MGMCLTILTDIIHFSIFYPVSDISAAVFRFSEGMAILNLLLKPATCFFVYQMYRERGGEYNVNFGKRRMRRVRHNQCGCCHVTSLP